MTKSNKASKKIELQKQSANNNATKGQTRTSEAVNGAHPVDGAEQMSTWVCKNLACKAVIPSEHSFCRRCSCCICRRFDENKDPSLWLVCASDENDGGHYCGSSFHIECLLGQKRVGCFDIENIIHLDGSFSCAACGKISGILGNLKRQLVIGKDARRVDFLCYRIHLIYKLLEGTNCFKELCEIIEEAKEKLESEVGPLDGVSAKMEHGLVRRSSTGIGVQELCSIAIQKVDEWLSSPGLHIRDSLPAACRFKFLGITASSLIVILKETSSSDTIKGYKLWYWKSREQPSIEEPVILPKDERKILVFNLSPCTEYSFRVISFTDDGILGHSESRCYTGSMDISLKRATQNTAGGGSQVQERDRNESFKVEGFKIRNIWNTYQEKWAGEGSGSRSATAAKQQGNSEQELLAGACCKLHYNPSSVHDPNAVATVAIDHATGKQYHHSRKRLVRSNDSGDLETCGVGGNAYPPAVVSQPDGKLPGNGCKQGDTCAICREKHISGERRLGEDYEQCIKVIRQLECDGHIESDFRKNFLTWYSLRSTEKERGAVTTFIKTFGEDAAGLADQLVDCFGETVKGKKFCDKLWH